MRLSPFVAVLVVLIARGWAAELKVSALFGDNACIQAGRPVAVWGWGNPGNNVTVSLGDSSADTVVEQSGRWKVQLDPVKAGGPFKLVIKSGSDTIESENILAGEVWLASGQSNMFWPLERAEGGENAIAAAANDQIRLFRCEIEPSFEEATDPRGKWEVCGPDSARAFSGVAYFFGKDLQKQLKVPVGLIQTALGGTPIEGWLPPEVWEEDKDFARIRKVQEDLADNHMRKKYERLLAAWKRGGSKPDKKPAAPDYASVDQNDPSVCFNVGIAPIAPYGIAGFLWYQGEWNTSRASDYGKLLETLVTRWRGLWGSGDLPFYVVQLPSIGAKPAEEPVELKSHWAALREKQADVLKLENTGLVVTMDVGGELHPPYKRQVGERLARWALANAYGKKVQFSGPVLGKAEPSDGRLELTFDHAEDLVMRPVGKRSGFAVAGDDKVYHPADAVVQGSKVKLSSPAVPEPKYVRYLWAQNPSVTLFNGEGLPAAPFRTELWEDFAVEPYEKSAK